MTTVERLQLHVGQPCNASGSFSNEEHGTLLSKFARHAYISYLLKPASNLRVLVLEMPYGHETLGRVDLEDLVANVHLPNLESLTLRQIQTKPERLLTFLLEHSTTLKRLCLCALLNRGQMTWTEFFQTIAGKLPRLESMKLRGQFVAHMSTQDYDGYSFSHSLESKNSCLFEMELSRYIIDGGPKFPDCTLDALSDGYCWSDSEDDEPEIRVLDEVDDTDEE